MVEEKKEVKISCQGAEEIPLVELVHFQGELKSLAQTDYCRLKKEILELGFSEPVSVWVAGDGRKNILNGHQRVRTLRKMEEEGYEVPSVPVNLIEASDSNEAKRKVLALTSQYGKIEEAGLFDFLSETDILPEELSVSYRFPEINIPKFTEKFFPEDPDLFDVGGERPETPPEAAAVPVNETSGFGIKMVQLFLNESSYPDFKEKVDRLCEERGFSNMTKLLVSLVEEAHGGEN